MQGHLTGFHPDLQGLLARTCTRSCKDLWQDFIRIFTTSAHKDLYKTLVKIFIFYGPLRLQRETIARSSYRRTFQRIHKISFPESQGISQNQHRATRRAIRHAQTVKRGLRERYPNSHCTTRRESWHAQSAERVTWAISKFAPRHNESDPTRTKCRQGFASDIKICTAPQRQRSDTPRLREHMLDFRKTLRSPRKN